MCLSMSKAQHTRSIESSLTLRNKTNTPFHPSFIHPHTPFHPPSHTLTHPTPPFHPPFHTPFQHTLSPTLTHPFIHPYHTLVGRRGCQFFIHPHPPFHPPSHPFTHPHPPFHPPYPTLSSTLTHPFIHHHIHISFFAFHTL